MARILLLKYLLIQVFMTLLVRFKVADLVSLGMAGFLLTNDIGK